MADLAWTDATILLGGLLVIFAAVILRLLIEDVRRERPARPVICADCRRVHHTPYPAASRVEPDRE